MPSKADVTEMRIRVPRAVYDWIKDEAERNACSLNQEVLRSCVERIRRAQRAERRSPGADFSAFRGLAAHE